MTINTNDLQQLMSHGCFSISAYNFYCLFPDYFENLPSDVNVPAFVGDEVTLPCLLKHPVNRRCSNSSFYDDIYKNGQVTEKYKSIVPAKPEESNSSLNLTDVTKERSGLYVCIANEGRGTEHGIRLTVSGKSNHLWLLLLVITDQ